MNDELVEILLEYWSEKKELLHLLRENIHDIEIARCFFNIITEMIALEEYLDSKADLNKNKDGIGIMANSTTARLLDESSGEDRTPTLRQQSKKFSEATKSTITLDINSDSGKTIVILDDNKKYIVKKNRETNNLVLEEISVLPTPDNDRSFDSPSVDRQKEIISEISEHFVKASSDQVDEYLSNLQNLCDLVNEEVINSYAKLKRRIG